MLVKSRLFIRNEHAFLLLPDKSTKLRLYKFININPINELNISIENLFIKFFLNI